jgi:hypothetical protein
MEQQGVLEAQSRLGNNGYCTSTWEIYSTVLKQQVTKTIKI